MALDTSKIIHAPVGGGRYTVTSPIVKEDYGLYLKIEGLELPSTYEVDFSNSEHNGTSVTMIGNADGVLIPHQFINSGKDVFAFLYHVGEDFGRTVYKFRIPNKVRPDRTDDEPTPEEQSTIDQCISALNDAVAQTAQDKADADVSAQNASADAERAEEARTDAQNYATQAEQSATSAQVSASQASAKAQDASQSATTASQKATEASQSASQASGYAQTAESAKTDAQTAQGKAEDAQNAAETAQGKAEDAQEAAETAAASIQSSASQIAQNTADIADLQTDVAQNEADILKAFPTDTASGAIASFSDGANGLPLKSLVVDINPVQDLSHGDPSPENLCPISGWDGVNIQRDGTNLFDGEMENGDINQYTGENNGTSSSRYRSKNYIPIMSGSYYFKSPNRTGTVRVFFYDKDKNFLWFTAWNVNAVNTFDNERTRYARFRFSTAKVDGDEQISINSPSSVTDYVPYNGRTIPISWQTEAGTVYGGKLDVLSGVMTVYPYYASYNGETLTGRWISDRDVYAVGTTPTIGAQVVNIGAEGTEYQLEPHEVASLLGQNNIFADTGDTSAEYRADTTLYISRLTEPDADMVADANITSGQYFMVGNNLYKATANIANGSAIVVGTNCIRKSLSEALNEINA